MNKYERSVVESIYLGFTSLYGSCQGLCGQIAEAIQNQIGGEIVAGYLDFGCFERQHWWLEKDGEIIDPMSDDLQKTDPHVHKEVHRDITNRYW